MLESVEAVKIALRVLNAFSERRVPDQADLQALRDYEPEMTRMAPDELACEVIQQALRKRALARAAE